MAATNRYISLNPGSVRIGKITETAAGTATDEVELRMLIIKADGTTHTNLQVMEICKMLEVFKAYLIRHGVTEFINQPGGGLPLPAPPPPMV